ncbi:D-alanyl-D-alanine carboxypeptidase [Oscillatoriales cyanobacterium LEGE 11467]|uniref:D-alanyl-D-alanine carboxypeptidase n=2 Tax=Zarconia TaxID=2992130 RepID=A0A928ZAE1_9CYAN|nr:D-alanyl-D-alanine carboxypeptidase [Zarconia navalis LEGE 11467]
MGILGAFFVGCSPNEPPVSQATSNLPPSDSTAPWVEEDNSTTQVGSTAPESSPEALLTVPPENPDTATQELVEQYLARLNAQGFGNAEQGVWMQTEDTLLANHQGTVRFPAASVTKVATALAALKTFGPDREFVTELGTTGSIENGVLNGDLVVTGESDPLFVWEEAIAVGNFLGELGIERVTGDLIVHNGFYMNFEVDSQLSGELFAEGINGNTWSSDAEAQYQTLPPGMPRPQVEIEGNVRVAASPPANVTPVLRHYSLPLAEQLKLMNRYSNNMVAQTLADAVGGADVVVQKAIEATGVPPGEIQLINGSGLEEDNQMSPRAAVALFLALQEYLEPLNLTVADVVAVVGKDEGILEVRSLPALSVVKSGSLNRVSTIAGGIPTQENGTIWIAIMNGGVNMQGFRDAQDVLLNQLTNQWGAVSASPDRLSPNPDRSGKMSRREIVDEAQL